MKNKLIILLIGKSSVGKDTLLNNLLRDEDIKRASDCSLHKAVSHTTRPMRTGEVQNKDYHFVEPYVFESMKNNNQFIETTRYEIKTENRVYNYGMSRKEIEDNENAIIVIRNNDKNTHSEDYIMIHQRLEGGNLVEINRWYIRSYYFISRISCFSIL